MNVIVTAIGAVSVTKEIYDKILQLKAANKAYGRKILYATAIPDRLSIKVEGSMPEVKTYEEFEKKFLPTAAKCPKCGHPFGLGRNIIV